MLPARNAWLLLAIGCISCGSHEITVEYREIDYAFSWTERRTIQRIADGTVAEARHQLPLLPTDLVLRVDADENVSDLTDSTATYAAPDRLYWSVDPHRGDGVVGTAGSHLRSMLLHELHHLVRDTALPRTSFMDSVISEGMASAFERDFAGASYPFMDYPNDVSTWVTELLALPNHDSFSPEGVAQRRHWLRQHPDGRRWIGYRAGTYVVDRAMRASGEISRGPRRHADTGFTAPGAEPIALTRWGDSLAGHSVVEAVGDGSLLTPQCLAMFGRWDKPSRRASDFRPDSVAAMCPDLAWDKQMFCGPVALSL